MDLKEIKKLVNFARKAGVKSITANGLTVEFKDEILIQRVRKPRGISKTEDSPAVTQPVPPSLDEINKFIYEGDQEAS